MKCLKCSTGSLDVTETKCLDCSVTTNYAACGICTGAQYFDVTSKTCQNCMANCGLCTESYNCFQCNDGYLLERTAANTAEATANTADKCTQITNCKTKYQDHCEVCNDGYTLQKGKCVACPENCNTCYLTDINSASSAKCTTCKTNYMPKDGACISETENNCAVGSPTYGCLKCKDGFYFDANYVCQPCNAECATCVDSADHCLSCKADHYFSTSGTKSVCVKMDANCKL